MTDAIFFANYLGVISYIFALATALFIIIQHIRLRSKHESFVKYSHDLTKKNSELSRENGELKKKLQSEILPVWYPVTRNRTYKLSEAACLAMDINPVGDLSILKPELRKSVEMIFDKIMAAADAEGFNATLVYEIEQTPGIILVDKNGKELAPPRILRGDKSKATYAELSAWLNSQGISSGFFMEFAG